MLNLIQYNEKEILKKNLENNVLLKDIYKKNYINWINIEFTEDKIVENIVNQVKVHHLFLEDILNFKHLPKIEFFEDYIFLNLKMIQFVDDKLQKEQINIVLTNEYLISVQAGKEGDVFDIIRKNLELQTVFLRKHKQDFLFYSIIDAVVDNYLKILEVSREKIVKLEESIFSGKKVDVIREVIEIKKEINDVRKYTLPLKDVISFILISENKLISKSIKVYFQDINDHIQNLIYSFENQREMLKDLIELHESQLNNDTNKIIKFLTIISTFFIPLTFIAGLYGMNFKYMPELEYRFSYPILLVAMATLVITMIVLMKKQKWI